MRPVFLEGKLIGSGSENEVFLLEDGKIFKGPRWWRQQLGFDAGDVLDGLNVLDKYEVAHLPTSVIAGPVQITTHERVLDFPYGMLQPRVDINVLKVTDLERTKVRKQLEVLLQKSAIMEERDGAAIDFTGQEALKQFTDAWLHQRPLVMAAHNFHLTPDDELILMDIGLLNFKGWFGLTQRPLAVAQWDLISRYIEASRATYEPEAPQLPARAISPALRCVTGWAYDQTVLLQPRS